MLKIKMSQFEDLMGFIQRFKNQTAAPVATRGELQRVLIGWRRLGQGAISKRKEDFKPGRLFLGEGNCRGLNHAD